MGAAPAPHNCGCPSTFHPAPQNSASRRRAALSVSREAVRAEMPPDPHSSPHPQSIRRQNPRSLGAPNTYGAVIFPFFLSRPTRPPVPAHTARQHTRRIQVAIAVGTGIVHIVIGIQGSRSHLPSSSGLHGTWIGFSRFR